MESALSNNKTMNNNNITYIMDEPVPHIGVATLSPTPFRRVILRGKQRIQRRENGMSTTTG